MKSSMPGTASTERRPISGRPPRTSRCPAACCGCTKGRPNSWGRVLATRAGQFSPAELRDRLAIEAAEIANRPGRAWRPLSDDVNYPAFMLRQAVPWRDWQRRRDYYSEGVMLWLAVDARLRELTHDRHSIDDFAARFFAGATPDGPTRTYTFEDVCSALNAVAPADWSGILRSWLDAHDELDTCCAGLPRSAALSEACAPG